MESKESEAGRKAGMVIYRTEIHSHQVDMRR